MAREIKMTELKKLLPLIMHRECKRREDSKAGLTAKELDSICVKEGFVVIKNSALQAIGSNNPYIERDRPKPIGLEATTYSLTADGVEEAERLQDEYGDIPLDTPLAEAIDNI